MLLTFIGTVAVIKVSILQGRELELKDLGDGLRSMVRVKPTDLNVFTRGCKLCNPQNLIEPSEVR